MVLATEINALRLEIVDGVNQFLKLPLISYVIDNTKTMINQVIIIPITVVQFETYSCYLYVKNNSVNDFCYCFVRSCGFANTST